MLLPLTLTVPAVPEETYPSVTDGVTFFEPLTLAEITPVELLTEMLGFAVILVAGVAAEPLAIVFEAAEP